MSKLAKVPPSPMDRLIRSLAEAAVNEYLTEEAASRKASQGDRSNPVPLPDMDKAA